MLIITGCMRSGTRTYSDILGIGHEANSWGEMKDTSFPEVPSVSSEASWMAAPYCQKLLDSGCKVIRLVRHPFKVVRSLVGIGFFEAWPKFKDQRRFRKYMYQHLPNLPQKGTLPCNIALLYWIQWNELISDQYQTENGLVQIPTVRIEDLINGPQLNGRTRSNIQPSDIEDELWQQARPLMKKWNYV